MIVNEKQNLRNEMQLFTFDFSQVTIFLANVFS